MLRYEMYVMILGIGKKQTCNFQDSEYRNQIIRQNNGNNVKPSRIIHL